MIGTWFAPAVQVAFNLTAAGYSALDAVELGCTYCEVNQCDGTVGWGGSPDSTGETTLDAILFDGETHDSAAVTDLRRIREATATARRVMHYTKHTLLSGEGATAFAIAQGFAERSLSSNASTAAYADWRAQGCYPNYWQNVVDAHSCTQEWVATPSYTPMPAVSPLPGAVRSLSASSVLYAAAASVSLPPPPPLREEAVSAATAAAAADADAAATEVEVAAAVVARPSPTALLRRRGAASPPYPPLGDFARGSLAMCALDLAGHLAGGGSSNGAIHRVAGRSSDISMVGAGLYVDKLGGCAAATGDGDITSRFLPAMAAVEAMRGGNSPQASCIHAVRRIMAYHDVFSLGLICLDRYGNVGAASHGGNFSFAMATPGSPTATMVHVTDLGGGGE